jgi:hypothetical protein
MAATILRESRGGKFFLRKCKKYDPGASIFADLGESDALSVEDGAPVLSSVMRCRASAALPVWRRFPLAIARRIIHYFLLHLPAPLHAVAVRAPRDELPAVVHVEYLFVVKLGRTHCSPTTSRLAPKG